MKFEDIEFPGKNKFKYSVVCEIYGRLCHDLDLEKFYYWSIIHYLEILIDDQDFNLKSKVFYDKVSNTKLNYDFLTVIAHDYIMDHVEDFTRKGI